ncbi:hypothetical protein F511_15832 [Dorcoceras hygrometricum]|uniref:Uncharacterized protein n=1 Tax=Dorcoceras hygrometricum TaxID=472368 RepID=A0A2Z7D1H3_9LAMI|nr:hypothetical protein F511_15832 [Dorcoceras hygrometricum]
MTHNTNQNPNPSLNCAAPPLFSQAAAAALFAGKSFRPTFRGESVRAEFIQEAVVEEISSFFYSFSLRSLLQSISDLSKKEEQVLQWAETDSLQTVVQRLLYIIATYRKMLLRKCLEARHNNFESGTPTSTRDLQVLDLLSEAHSSSLIKLMEQLKQHILERHSRVSQSFQYISSSSSSASSVSIRPRSPDAIPSSSSSSASRTHFTEHIPQTSMPIFVVHSADYTESFAQLRASVDKIQFEQIQTRDDVDELKAALSSKITGPEMRGRDDIKGEIESSRGPPDDQSRPSSGSSRPGEGGSRSEPPKRGGGSNRGGGSHKGRGSRSS